MTVGCTVRTAEGQQVCVCERQIVRMVHSGGARKVQEVASQGEESGPGMLLARCWCLNRPLSWLAQLLSSLIKA